MNIGLYRREHLQSGDARLIGDATADQFQRTHGALTAWQEIEHTDEGHHTNITADSLDVKGDVTIDGHLTVLGKPAQDIASEYADPTLKIDGFLRSTNTDPGGKGSMTLGGNSNGGEIAFTPDPAFVAFDPALSIEGNLRVFQSVDPTIPAISTNGSVQADLGFLERGRLVKVGEWNDVPFNAANFTATAPHLWTVVAGNVQTNCFSIVGKTLTWILYLNATTVVGVPGPGGPNQLLVTIPGGYTSQSGWGAASTGQFYDGAFNRGLMFVASPTQIAIQKDPFTPVTPNTGSTYLIASIVLRVN